MLKIIDDFNLKKLKDYGFEEYNDSYKRDYHNDYLTETDKQTREIFKDAIKTIGRNIIDKADDISRDVKHVREINITATLGYDIIPTIDVTKSYISVEDNIDTTTPILDDAEKRYLEDIIKPFKHRVLNITKRFHIHKEFIQICIADDSSILLPSFESNTMYTGMELDKQYTLDELGLFE